MQQTTIRFDQALEAQPQTIDVKATVREAVRRINQALDSKSEFYSRILGQAITWRKALRIGVVLPLLMVAVAVCVEQAPVVAGTSLAASGWIVYRLNQEEEGGKDE